eukprot:479906_1
MTCDSHKQRLAIHKIITNNSHTKVDSIPTISHFKGLSSLVINRSDNPQKQCTSIHQVITSCDLKSIFVNKQNEEIEFIQNIQHLTTDSMICHYRTETLMEDEDLFINKKNDNSVSNSSSKHSLNQSISSEISSSEYESLYTSQNKINLPHDLSPGHDTTLSKIDFNKLLMEFNEINGINEDQEILKKPIRMISYF